MEIEYGSVCSGIEAATLAWKPLGMRATWFAEIEAFPSAMLAHHHPNTPNLGDMRSHEQQMDLFDQPADMPCGCYDGE